MRQHHRPRSRVLRLRSRGVHAPHLRLILGGQEDTTLQRSDAPDSARLVRSFRAQAGDGKVTLCATIIGVPGQCRVLISLWGAAEIPSTLLDALWVVAVFVRKSRRGFHDPITLHRVDDDWDSSRVYDGFQYEAEFGVDGTDPDAAARILRGNDACSNVTHATLHLRTSDGTLLHPRIPGVRMKNELFDNDLVIATEEANP